VKKKRDNIRKGGQAHMASETKEENKREKWLNLVKMK